MLLKIEVSAPCEIDLDTAYRWYESQRALLGTEFLQDFGQRLQILAKNPQIGTISYQQVRKFVLQRFPYVLYYLATESKLTVIACLHGGINSGIKSRLLRKRTFKQ
jgi:toxin ParE1/3/4